MVAVFRIGQTVTVASRILLRSGIGMPRKDDASHDDQPEDNGPRLARTPGTAAGPASDAVRPPSRDAERASTSSRPCALRRAKRWVRRYRARRGGRPGVHRGRPDPNEGCLLYTS